MSNALINAVIALIENRPKDARAMLRSPELKVPVSELQMRLATALDKREKKAQLEVLQRVLQTTLRIDINLLSDWTDEQREQYLEGVADVETIIDNIITGLES